MQSKRSNLVVSNKITQRIKDYQKLCELLGIICFFAFAPLIVIILIVLYTYRLLVEIVLKIQFRKKFAGLLKGTDSVWAVEDIVSLSIINVLMILEKDTQNTNVIFLDDLRNLINDRIVSKAAGTSLEKLLYRRNQKFGYYFWEKNEEIDLKNKIRWLECEDVNCDGSCEDISSETFKRNLGNMYNRPLPDNNMAAWECLVGKRCTRSRSCVEEGRLFPEEHLNIDLGKIPIIFRIHHSLGDGVALLQVLLKAISEESEVKITKIKFDDSISTNKDEKDFREIIAPSHNLGKILQDEMEIARFYDKDIFVASIPFIYIPLLQIWKDLRSHFCALLKFCVTVDLLKQQMKMWINYMWLNFKNLLKQLCKKIIKVMRLTMILLSAPRCLIQQTIRSMDENALHGSPQTGEKLVSYWLEDDDVNKSQKLLMKIREIKNSTRARFGDIILAAFSASVQKYHICINKPAPDALTAIIPIRMTMPDENITLDNKFSLAYLQICISNVNGQIITEPHKDSQFFKRLQDITRAHNELRKGPNILLNSWIIKYLSAILPARILKALLSNLSFSTMVFSNMCGPQKVRILNNTLSNMIFWVPNKDNAALGFSLLSYGGNLHLSLIADKSIIEDERLFMEILEDTVHEIDIAYNSITHAFMNH